MSHSTKKLLAVALMVLLSTTLLVTLYDNGTIGHAQLEARAQQSLVSQESRWLATAKQQLHLADTIYLLDAKTQDVTGDGTNDGILLVGTKGQSEDRYAFDLDLIVRDGQNGNFTAAKLHDLAGYDAKLFVGDFDGDKIADLMITAPSGGSGGITNHRIVTFANNTPILLFGESDNVGAKFSGQFLDNFRAELTLENTGRKTIVDMSDAKTRYIETGIYNEKGTLLKPVSPYSYPFGILEPIDPDGDGTYTLKGIQKVVGAYNADVVTHVYSYWEYGSNKRWTPYQFEIDSLTPDLSVGTQIQPDMEYQAESKQMRSQYADVSYPQFADISNLSTREYVNQKLESAARELVGRATADSPVAVEYEVTRSDNSMLSVIFKGTQKWESGSYPILTAVNIELQTRNPVMVENLFRSDRESQQGINTLLAEAAKKAGIANSPSLGTWMGMYMTNQDVVIFYQENDHTQENMRLYLPLEKVKRYLNDPIKPLKQRS